MGKAKIARVAGFVGALGASATLVGFAATGTGAYFTDSHNGNISASSGHMRITTDTPTNLNFAGLNPGEDKTMSVYYTPEGNNTTKTDVWLVFDPNSAGYKALSGPKTTNSDGTPGEPGGLGRYGHFAVTSDQGAYFRSYNLQASDPGVGCPVDAYGSGGSDQKPASVKDAPPLCGVPTAIKLDSNLSPGQQAHMALTFGITGRWKAQDSPVANVDYKLIATQPGIRPDAGNF